VDYAVKDLPRVLFLDIETKPAIVASFGIRDQHIGHKQILQDGGTICVGVGWGHESKIRVLSVWEHGYRPMLEEVHKLLCEADAVCTYNGASFDMPKLMGNFLLESMPPPPPPTQIDIYKAVRKLGFICNKLDYVAPLLGLGSKVKHEGLEMWLAVMNGDPKAQRRMAKYCAGDVRLLKQVYERVKSYVFDHPHMGTTPALACGTCGSSRVTSQGVRRTKASFIQRLQCQRCGSWQTGKRVKA
jgi:uncharacterized protein YprB with RNaseH-like and TPR domain